MSINMWIWIWLGIMVVTLIIELITVGLTSIWLTGGAVVALAAAFLNVPVPVQIGIFFVVTFILLFFTRPFAVRAIDSKKIKTNYEEIIGKEVRVLEDIDNEKETGKALHNGMEWTARAKDSKEHFKKDEIALVAEVSGVKLLLAKKV